MSLRRLPEISADMKLDSADFDIRSDVLEKWHPGIRAAIEDDATISMYDVIGSGMDGEGVTTKRISAALRSIGGRDVTVNINSPGGNFFDGVAIYNMLREHRAKVTVRVMGLAASAASVIAMAGDEILMGDGAFLMIHNSWAITIGNRHDLEKTIQRLEPFDHAMAQVYAGRSGISMSQAAQMMDRETWLDASQAVDRGFADGLIEGGDISDSGYRADGQKALALVESSLARSGYSRSERRETLKTLFSGTPRAAEPAMPCAGDETVALLQSVIHSMR